MVQLSAKGTSLLLGAQRKGLVGEGVLISDGHCAVHTSERGRNKDTIFSITYFNSTTVSIGSPIDCSHNVRYYVQMRKQTS